MAAKPDDGPTPGPWTAGTDFSPSSAQAVVRGPDGSILARVGDRFTPRSRSLRRQADAALMAASRNLLATTKATEDFLAAYIKWGQGDRREEPPAPYILQGQVRAALAKVPGGA